jgi:hypothetical protein
LWFQQSCQMSATRLYEVKQLEEEGRTQSFAEAPEMRGRGRSAVLAGFGRFDIKNVTCKG